jgi:hypothetical protein
MCICLPPSTSVYPLLARPLYRALLSVTACRVTRGVAGSSRRWRSRRCMLRREPAMRWTWSGRETRRRKRRALGRRSPDSGVTSTSSGVQGVSRAPFCFRTVHCALHSKPRLRRPGRKAERRTRPCSHLCDATLGGRLVDLLPRSSKCFDALPNPFPHHLLSTRCATLLLLPALIIRVPRGRRGRHGVRARASWACAGWCGRWSRGRGAAHTCACPAEVCWTRPRLRSASRWSPSRP